MQQMTVTARQLADMSFDEANANRVFYDADTGHMIGQVSEPEPGVIAIRWGNGPEGVRLGEQDTIRIME